MLRPILSYSIQAAHPLKAESEEYEGKKSWKSNKKSPWQME